MIKKYYTCLAVICVCFVYTSCANKPAADTEIVKRKDSVFVELKIIKTDFGFGYEIYKDHQPFIRQDYIPAIEGRKGFVNEAQAKTLGNYVIWKMTEGRMQFPQVTVREIDSLHITH